MQQLGYHEHLLKLAAVVYRSGIDDIDALLAGFAADVICKGHRIGGVVQHNGARGQAQGSMSLIDLMNGREISISQPLGAKSDACRLDPAGLAEASVAVRRAVDERVELVIVNKFSKQEAAGRGLRGEIAEAVVAGLPIITAVSDKSYEDWLAFTGGYGTTLVCDRRILDDWWREMAHRESRARVLANFMQAFEAAADAQRADTHQRPLLAYDDVG